VAQTILVVEDEVFVRLDMADYLGRFGYDVFEASNASEAMSLIRSRADIDVVFTDVRMPGCSMDGMALAQWIIENRPEIAVIITSGDTAKDAAMNSLCGAHVFSKPYEPAQVTAKIREIFVTRKLN